MSGRGTPMPDRGRARHAGDAARLLAAATVVALATLVAARGVTPSEAAAFALFNDLPRIVTPIAYLALVVVSPFTIAAAALAALVARRRQLAAELLVAGAGAYGLARLLQHLVARPAPPAVATAVGHVHHLTVPGAVAASGAGFPSAAVAVAAGLATAAGPFVRRPAARLAWVFVGVFAAARMYAGADLPLDVVAGVALGSATGAALNLALGAPTGHPAPAAVVEALADAGVAVRDLRARRAAGSGYVEFDATTGDGDDLFVKVLGREERSADIILRLLRFVALRGEHGDLVFVTRKRQAEHEALMATLAARAGCRTPALVAVGRSRGGATFVAYRRVGGHPLDEARADVTDDALCEVWDQVRRLHAARLAHLDLRRARVRVDDRGRPWLLHFAAAEAAASVRQRRRDLADLLVSLALAFGPARAVDTAAQVLGVDALVDALPMLQPLALSRATMREPGARRAIREVRELVETRSAHEPPPRERISRVRPRTILAVVVLGFAVQLLLPQVGRAGATIAAARHARVPFLLLAALAATASFPAAAVAQAGAVSRRVRLLPMAVVQLACSFTNRVTPAGMGGLGLNERHLERVGVARAVAVSAVGVNAVAGAIVHAAGTFLALGVLGEAGIGGVDLPRGWWVLVAVVVALAACGLVVLTPHGRRLARPARAALHDLRAVMRSPTQTAMLFGGSAGVTLANALALAACLTAFGAHAPVAETIVVYLGASAVASVSPTPGALGAVEAALVAGLTGVGVAAGPAVAGVLAFRLLTFWLPTLPGVWALAYARRQRWV